MRDDNPLREQELRFFATAPRDCSYLADRSAISVFADPDARLSSAVYQQLAGFGFRRSGNDLYVPACPGCSECIPVRIPVQQFKRSRNQQKVWNRNLDLEFTVLPAQYRDEHFDLYARYLSRRHPGGGMDQPTPDDYMNFLTSDWCETLFLEFRLADTPVAVAVTDRLGNALSAVYTFFDPALSRRSLGTYSVLRQIELGRELACDWHYLGYWIPGCGKMQYKSRFRPLQAYQNGNWITLGTGPAGEADSDRS
jgi:arginyl-tRNA--protein-N-Asp/Glu arginylyltransferase